MMRFFRVLLACTWLVACSSSSDDPETLIGATCESADECDPSGICVTDGADGLCSQLCAIAGGPQQCPLGNYCDTRQVTTDTSDRGERTLCLPACKSDSDCRDGYKCTGVSSGPGKVCGPK
ncbi:MAG: hypothetical protein RL701_762 [Pseudomonadota bacterium]